MELPDGNTAVALALTQSSMGRDMRIIPAVAVHDWPSLIDTARKITLLSTPPTTGTPEAESNAGAKNG